MRWMVDASGARHSGALTHHLGMLPALDALAGADEIHVIASAELTRAMQDRVSSLVLETLEAAPGLGRYAALHSRIVRRIREFRPDAVLFGQYAPTGVRAAYVLRMTDAHLVDHDARRRLLRHYSARDRLAWHVKLSAFRRSLEDAAAVLCATSSVRDQLLHAHPWFDPERIVVAPYGVSPLVQGARAHPGVRRRRLLTMHLSPRKNVEQILEAMAHPALRDVELTVLGDLRVPRTRYTRFLARRVYDLGLAERVHSVGYVSDPASLLDLLLAHDALVCASTIESWSHTVVEGLALGMPVIASDIACHREVAEDAAWFADVRDPAQLAAVLEEVLGGGAQVDARRARGREQALRFDWQIHAEGVLASLRRAAAHARPPADAVLFSVPSR